MYYVHAQLLFLTFLLPSPLALLSSQLGCHGTFEASWQPVFIKLYSVIIWNGLSRRLYWIDARLDYIAFCDYNGAHRQTVLRDGAKIQHPFSIAQFEDMVYWSDWFGQQVEQGNKFHGGNHTLIHAASFKPMDLYVVHPLQQPKGKWKT